MDKFTQKQIVLFTPDAKLTDEVKALLVANDYIPVEVASMDSVKVLPPVVPQAQLDMMSKAAMEVAYGYNSTTQQHFGAAILKIILGKK